MIVLVEVYGTELEALWQRADINLGDFFSSADHDVPDYMRLTACIVRPIYPDVELLQS